MFKHPIIGKVKWMKCLNNEWVLVFADGSRQGQKVNFGNENIMLDDTWVKR